MEVRHTLQSRPRAPPLHTLPTRYPDRFAFVGMDVMATLNVPASKMPRLMRQQCQLWLDEDAAGCAQICFGSESWYIRLRYAVPYVCMVHIGALLSLHSHKTLTQTQDGTPVDTRYG